MYFSDRYCFLKYFSNCFHDKSFSWTPFTFLRSSHHMEAFPFRLNMVIQTFKFSKYPWNLKYFFKPRSQTSTSSPFLISPSKVGGLDLLNSLGSGLLECFHFFIFLWECKLVFLLEYSLELSVSSPEDSSDECLLDPCWPF